jgi:hypothetical protein
MGDRGLSPMDHTFERREVKVEDPSLSGSANEALTKEVREVLGDDHVEVPEETPHREREARGRRSAGTATLANNRLLLIGAAVLVPGGIFTFSSSPRESILAGLAVITIIGGTVLLVWQVLRPDRRW